MLKAVLLIVPESNSNQAFVCFLGVDTRLKFTIEPSLGKNGFQQVSAENGLHCKSVMFTLTTILGNCP